MRIPQSWNDRAILLDEPLRSAFVAREVTHSKPRSIKTIRYRNAPIIERIRAEENGTEAVEAWLRHAFPKDDLSVDFSLFFFFVDFYWCLYTDMNDVDARRMVNIERARRGLTDVKKSKCFSRQPRTAPTIPSPAGTKKVTLRLKSEASISRTDSDINSKPFSAKRKSSSSSRRSSKRSKTTETPTSSVAGKHLGPSPYFAEEPTLEPDPIMEAETPSTSTAAAPMELEKSRDFPKRRSSSISLNEGETKRHEVNEADAPVESMERMESGDIIRLGDVSGIGTPEERVSLQKEIAALEEMLKRVDGWEQSAKEIEQLLGL